ncbi:M23 family metallopeptidase [Candidatus Dojkabacteria bacterium]|nr:M23 family metallopeptidase [Candidatus Dojkabacteria bacterium]
MKNLLVPIFISLFFLHSSLNVFAGEKEIKIPIREDAYVESIFFDESFGMLKQLLLGFNNSSREGITRIYVKYDTRELGNVFVDNIKSASLKLYQYKVNSTFDYPIRVAYHFEPWSENTIMMMNTLINPTRQETTSVIPATVGWTSVNITEKFLEHMLNPESNRGVALLMKNEEEKGGVFWSKDCVTLPASCNPEYIPYVSVIVKTVDEVPAEENEEKDEEKDEDIESKTDSDIEKLTESIDSSTDRIVEAISDIEETPETTPSIVKEESNITEDNVVDTTRTTSGVLGVRSHQGCKYIWNATTDVVRKFVCTLDTPVIKSTKIEYRKNTGTYITTNITLPKSLEVTLEKRECSKASITNPITLFKCVEKQISTRNITDSSPYIDIYLNIDGKWYPTFKKETSTGYTTSLNLSFKPKSELIQAKYLLSSSTKLKERVWLDIFEMSPHSVQSSFKIIEQASPTYVFPLKTLSNVTQWHGKTAYSNHTGIDFEAGRVPVLATSDGTVDYIGWDNSSGKCLSGGNYIKLKHSDGKYSTYLHLNSFTKGLKKGSPVKKGTVIGISGNSGMYNCEPLTNHLHFEVRKSPPLSSHINPVPLINIDWAKVKTARANIYPVRLTGDNPHPKY